jgi:hypothetical protein
VATLKMFVLDKDNYGGGKKKFLHAAECQIIVTGTNMYRAKNILLGVIWRHNDFVTLNCAKTNHGDDFVTRQHAETKYCDKLILLRGNTLKPNIVIK